MKLSELLWGLVFAVAAAAIARLDYKPLAGRLLGLALIAGGWAVLAALVATSQLSLGTGAVLAALVTAGVIVGVVAASARDRLVKVRVPSRRRLH